MLPHLVNKGEEIGIIGVHLATAPHVRCPKAEALSSWLALPRIFTHQSTGDTSQSPGKKTRRTDLNLKMEKKKERKLRYKRKAIFEVPAIIFEASEYTLITPTEVLEPPLRASRSHREPQNCDGYP